MFEHAFLVTETLVDVDSQPFQDFARARLIRQHVDEFDQPWARLVQMVVTDVEFGSPDEIADALLP